MRRPTRVRWWLDHVTPQHLAYRCRSVAISTQNSSTWTLGRHNALTPHEAMRWLVDHVELHELNASEPVPKAAGCWLDNADAVQAQVTYTLAQGWRFTLRLHEPGVEYHIQIQPALPLQPVAPYATGES